MICLVFPLYFLYFVCLVYLLSSWFVSVTCFVCCCFVLFPVYLTFVFGYFNFEEPSDHIVGKTFVNKFEMYCPNTSFCFHYKMHTFVSHFMFGMSWISGDYIYNSVYLYYVCVLAWVCMNHSEAIENNSTTSQQQVLKMLSQSEELKSDRAKNLLLELVCLCFLVQWECCCGVVLRYYYITFA